MFFRVGHANALLVVAVISIPTLPASPAVPKAPQQPVAAAGANDGLTSFANFLKSAHARTPQEESNASSMALKLSTGAKDKAEKDAKKNDKGQKSSLPSDAVPVPVSASPLAEPRSFQLSWLHAKSGDTNAQTAKASSESGANANAKTAQEGAGDEQDLKSNALQGSVAEAVHNAPVAFGANLSKMDNVRLGGLKAEDAKTQGQQGTGENRPKAPGSENNTAKTGGEIAKASESKASSGKQQEHADSSREDAQPAPINSMKPEGAAAGTQSESAAAAVHAVAATAPGDASGAASAVQNAYAPAHAAPMDKTGPAASTTAVTEPAQTPSVRPQNIDLKIAGADNSQVDVRVSQRAGDVQVTVRTPDGDLAQSLRQHLPELSDRLSQAGVSGDLWQPQTAQAANTGGNDADSRYSDDAQTQQQGQQQQHSRNNSQDEQQQQQGGNTPPSAWLNELNQANKESK